MGDDLRVVNAARVSFNKESEFEKINRDVVECHGAPIEISCDYVLSSRDTKLIAYLAKHNHWTPFAHPMITLRETVPIFVARQRFKHMVGFTYNEVSRRYVNDPPEYFTPTSWRGKPKNAKQGSSDEVIVDLRVQGFKHQSVEGAYNRLLDHAHDLYLDMIAAGVCPEQARMVLPQSMFTSYYVTGSLASWARAYKQRIDSHAQVEIQGLAASWNTIIRPLFPVSWEALTRE